MKAISKTVDEVLGVDGKSMGMTCVSPTKPFTSQQEEIAKKERKISASLYEIARVHNLFNCVLVPQDISDILTGSYYWQFLPTKWSITNYREIGTIFGNVRIYSAAQLPIIRKFYFGDTIEDIDKLIIIEQRKEKLEKLNRVKTI